MPYSFLKILILTTNESLNSVMTVACATVFFCLILVFSEIFFFIL